MDGFVSIITILIMCYFPEQILNTLFSSIINQTNSPGLINDWSDLGSEEAPQHGCRRVGMNRSSFFFLLKAQKLMIDVLTFIHTASV